MRPPLVTILVIGLLAVACGDSGPTLESDESGIVRFHDFSQGSESSFGIFVCAAGGEVELESVEPMSQEGEIELLGALVHESDAGFIGADDEFPPGLLAGTELVPIEGAVVTTTCEEAAPVVMTQVLVGVSRTGPTGGTIEGIRINHENGSLEIEDLVIILCGDQLEGCEDFAPEG